MLLPRVESGFLQASPGKMRVLKETREALSCRAREVQPQLWGGKS